MLEKPSHYLGNELVLFGSLDSGGNCFGFASVVTFSALCADWLAKFCSLSHLCNYALLAPAWRLLNVSASIFDWFNVLLMSVVLVNALN